MYLQIMEQIQSRIAGGDWPPGKELPSIRALAADLQVSVITVKRAYLDLEAAGAIITRQGKGSFVADSPASVDQLQEQQLATHLKEIASLARRLGISERDLLMRLQRATGESS